MEAMDGDTFVQAGHVVITPCKDVREVSEQVEKGLVLLR